MRIRYSKLNIKKVKRKFLSQAKKIYSIYRIQQVLFIHPTMSLFNEIQWQVIENPKSTYNNIKIRKEKKEKDNKENEKKKKQERKKLCEQKKEELWEDEYKKRYWKQRYKDNREHHIQKEINRQKEKRKEEEALIEGIYKNVYDILPEPIDIDKFYTEKFKNDDILSGEYKFSWRSSRLKRIPWRKYSRQHLPFRVSYRHWINQMMATLSRTQLKAYQYLLPLFNEWKDCPISLHKRQQPYRYPTYLVWEPLQSIIDASEINNWHLICVADGIRRGKYIPWEVYLWRNSFIFWDVVVTNTWHLFRISLEHNLKWLTPNTVEKIHQDRMDWRKKKADNKVPILLLWDAYLIKVPINEWEDLYFITPT